MQFCCTLTCSFCIKIGQRKNDGTALTVTEAEQAFAKDRPLDSVLVFLASLSKKSARELPAPASEVFKGIAELADQLVMNVIEKRTAAEFKEAFEFSFPKYAAITLSLSQFASVIVTPDVRERLTRESICELEADFRDRALVLFGASVRTKPCSQYGPCERLVTF